MFLHSSKIEKVHIARKKLFSLGIAICSAVLVISSYGASAAHAKKLSYNPNKNDPAIADTVKNELLSDRTVTFTGLDVTVTNGIVSLKGKVTNLLAKQRAQVLAETVRGVRAVINRIEVAPKTQREDWLLEKDIKTALFENLAANSFEIDASVKSGIAALTGKVQSDQEKELAGQLAMSVPGISAVANKIDVDFQVDRPDFDVKADVKERLRWDALVENDSIQVDVKKGTVKLSGVVGSAAEKSRAYYDAWISGVVDVDDSNLKVKAWAYDKNRRHHEYVAKTESQIGKAVRDALLYDPRVKSFEVGVDVDINSVTLHGTVDNATAKRAAGEDARSTVGVFLVRNQIKVRSEDTAHRTGNGKRS